MLTARATQLSSVELDLGDERCDFERVHAADMTADRLAREYLGPEDGPGKPVIIMGGDVVAISCNGMGAAKLTILLFL